ncbi:MAG: hypothetical protein ABW166_14225 [Sedimenticola sp.]
METVNIHDAKTHLSRLLEEARRGKPFIRLEKRLKPPPLGGQIYLK